MPPWFLYYVLCYVKGTSSPLYTAILLCDRILYCELYHDWIRNYLTRSVFSLEKLYWGIIKTFKSQLFRGLCRPPKVVQLWHPRGNTNIVKTLVLYYFVVLDTGNNYLENLCCIMSCCEMPTVLIWLGSHGPHKSIWGLRMYCIDTGAIAFMFHGGSSCGSTI